MKILHTSDWHLGKMLENFSRLEEQEEFIDELVDIADNEKIDMVIISGDIYDTSNPPAFAEKLFYDAIKRLSNNKKRPIIIISGNHDSPERLEASAPIASENAVFIIGSLKTVLKTGTYDNFSIVNSGEGFFEISLNSENVVVITLPYPSEKRLNELLSDTFETEQDMQKSYSDKIGEIFDKLSDNFRDDTINIAVSHIFMLGGQTTDSERPIQLGGSLSVNVSSLPKNAHYIALGHLHRPQKVNDITYYSGSPIQYSKSELNYSKAVNIVEVTSKTKACVKKVLLRNYKPIEVWDCESVEKAIEKCEQNSDRNVWVYLNINTDRVISSSELKKIKTIKKDIVQVFTKLPDQEMDIDEESFDDKNIYDYFKLFYTSQKGIEPSQKLVDLFYEINEKGDEDETKNS